jgi:hypothetical protein
MSRIDLKANFTKIYNLLIEQGGKPTSIAHQIGFTTTTQLQNVLSGKSQLSTQAVIGMIANLKVSPTYLFLGEGDMFITDEQEVNKLRKANQDLVLKHNEDQITIIQFKDEIDKLEKRNADLIDMSSAALKYYKEQKGAEQADFGKVAELNNRLIKVLKYHGLLKHEDTEINIDELESSMTRKRK